MMKTVLAAVGGVTLLAGAAFSAMAVAGGDRGHRMFNPDRMIKHFSKRLDLDDAQAAEIRGIVDEAMPVMQAAREDMKAGRTRIVELDPTADDYSAQVDALAEQAAQHARAVVTQLGQARLDVNSVLNEEQRAQFDEMLAKSKRWGRHHKRDKKAE